MDKPALFALATATLVQAFPDKFDDNANTDPQTGAHNPDTLAADTLRLWDRYDDIKRLDHPDIFGWGFDFGLQLGAAIAENPGRIPEIRGIPSSILVSIEESILEQAKKEREAA